MPNWCNNHVILSHKNKEMIDRAVKAAVEGKFLGEFIPCPAELLDTTAGYGDESNQNKRESNLEKYGFADWYDWCVNNWGTKWDVGAENGIERINDTSLEFSFDSAWSPPTTAFEKLCGMGFEITAYYNETGMAFCGKFEGEGENTFDDYFEYGSETSETVRDLIGTELDEFYCISENMAEWESENEEESE